MELNKKTLRNIFIGVAGCILLYWVLHEFERVKAVLSVIKGVIAPFVIGSVLAFIFNVPMRAIESKLTKIKKVKLRRIIALALTFLAAVIVLGVIFLLLIPQIIDSAGTFADNALVFFNGIQSNANAFLNNNPELMNWVMDNIGLEKLDVATLIQKVIDMVGTSVSTIISGAYSAIGSLIGVVANAFIGTIFAVYCLFNKETLATQGRKLLYSNFSEKFADETVRILRLTNSTFSNFLSGQCLEVTILGVMFAISMAIFRMPYIPLVSVLVAVTAFVPVVGAFAGCIVGALFILVDNPIQAVWFVVMFLVIQQIENNIIYPRVVGTSIGLPGMWVLVALTVGGELMGVVGMFLMIPVASVLYTLVRERTNAKLSGMSIDGEKLHAQPPDLKSKLKENRKKRKEKRDNRVTDQEEEK